VRNLGCGAWLEFFGLVRRIVVWLILNFRKFCINCFALAVSVLDYSLTAETEGIFSLVVH